MNRLLLIFLLCVFAAGVPVLAAPGQERGSTPPLAFEVASVKENTSGGFGAGIDYPAGGRLTAENMSPKMLIASAFRIQPFQISGGPSWFESAKYDIEGKSESIATPDQLREMLRTLLVQRFHLQSHEESKQMTVYTLSVAKGGIKMTPSKFDENDRRNGVRSNRGRLSGQHVPVSILAQILSNQLSRVVIDGTNLSGVFDFILEWTPDVGEAPSAKDGMIPSQPSADAPVAPSLVTALQEQLGLRLESSKGPVDILVIDHAEKPAANGQR